MTSRAMAMIEAWLGGVAPERTGAWRGVMLGCVASLMIYVSVLMVHAGGKSTASSFGDASNVISCSFALIGTSLCAWRGQFNARSARRSWALLALGYGFTVAAECVYYYEHHVVVRERSVPTFSDCFYLLAYPFLFAGLMGFFVRVSPSRRVRLLIDSSLTSSALGALVWVFVLRPLWHADETAPFVEKLIAVSYPMMDAVLAWVAFALALSSAAELLAHRRAWCLSAAMLLWSLSDTFYSYSTLNNSYVSGKAFDAGWVFSYVLVGLLGLSRLWGTPEPAAQEGQRYVLPQEVSLLRALVPYLAIGATMGIIGLHQWRTTHTIGGDVLLYFVIALCLILTRQMVTLGENVRLTRQLQRFNAELDAQVQERTREVQTRNRQMDALLRLNKAINSTLDEQQVLTRAAEGARRALNADGLAIWILPEGEGAPGSALAATCGLAAQEDVREALECLSERSTLIEPVEGLALRLEGVMLERAPGVHLVVRIEMMRRYDKVIGVLGALRRSHPGEECDAFETSELRLLESIGFEVGAALENARMYARAVAIADHDPVTGLLNHRAIQTRYEREFARAHEEQTPLAVVMMDMNGFKLFNDTYGHPAGDEVLKRVAHLLSSNCRSDDFVARYGGDEFMMVLPGADARVAIEVSNRIRERMSMEEFLPEGAHAALPVSLCFGVAAYPDDAHSRSALLAMADANLYRAKGSREEVRSTSDVARSRGRLMATDGFSALDAMVTAVDNKDLYTRRHSEDVTEYALWLAEELKLGEDSLRALRIGGMVHDVGKICVPDEILKKPASLSPDEFAVMKQHPWVGALIVGTMLGRDDVIGIVRSHHERWDGHGYPDNLKGEDIPLLGRLLAVADAFSAMTTARPYRRGMEWEVALDRIREGAGTQFDPHMARTFVRMMERQKAVKS